MDADLVVVWFRCCLAGDRGSGGMVQQMMRPCPRCARHRTAIMTLGYAPFCSFCGGSGEIDASSAWEQITNVTRLSVMLDEIVHLLEQGRVVPIEIMELARDALSRHNNQSSA